MVTRAEAEAVAQQLGFQSLEIYGAEHQLRQTQEEAAELIVASSKLIRAHERAGDPMGIPTVGHESEVEALAREAADVYIMLEQVRMLIGDEAINTAIRNKAQARLGYLASRGKFARHP